MRIAFYITNHGYGHASRNVPIILELLRRVSNLDIYICSDGPRLDFMKRNFAWYGKDVSYETRIHYRDGIGETGLVLKPGTMEPDPERMREEVIRDYSRWDDYIIREETFLRDRRVDLVVADIVAWALTAAKNIGIPGILIGNFSWAQMYRGFYGDEFVKPYREAYGNAVKAFWYAIHAKELETYCGGNENLSLISRERNPDLVAQIRSQYRRPIVFISLGASAELAEAIEVGDLPYDFLTTRGIHLHGDNVTELPMDMVNTPDYIAASDYIIAKGGWSTVAEILLARKKSALLLRGNNPEDNNTKEQLEASGQSVILDGSELRNIGELVERIRELKESDYSYSNDLNAICEAIIGISQVGG